MKAFRAFYLTVTLSLSIWFVSGCATYQHSSSAAESAADERTSFLDWLLGDGSGLVPIWTDNYGNLRSH